MRLKSWHAFEAAVWFILGVETRGRTLEELNSVFDAKWPPKEALKKATLVKAEGRLEQLWVGKTVRRQNVWSCTGEHGGVQSCFAIELAGPQGTGNCIRIIIKGLLYESSVRCNNMWWTKKTPQTAKVIRFESDLTEKAEGLVIRQIQPANQQPDVHAKRLETQWKTDTFYINGTASFQSRRVLSAHQANDKTVRRQFTYR